MQSSAPITRPNVFDYIDYRLFLQEIVKFLKAKRQFSTRRFAQRAGFKGNSFLTLVVKGKRNLSPKSIKKVAQGLKLSSEEGGFFELLVQFAIAKSFEEKEKAYKEIVRSKKFQQVHAITQAESDYFKHWYIVAILEAIGTSFGSRTDAEMAEALGITLEELVSALHVLARLGLIERKSGGWIRKHISLQTPAEVRNKSLGRFHREMIMKGAESIERIASEERSISALTVPLTKEAFLELKNKITELQKSLGVVHGDDADPDNVYQFNVQIFPIVALKPKDS